MEDNTLLISSIDVRAPIIWDIPLDEALNGLQRGVVHARESYLPGEAGRTFIVGHSSGYWWLKNPWTKIFSLLDHVNDGDLVFLKLDGQTYAYRVTHREVVSPKNVDVIRDEQLDHNQLALMTCTPVGTSLNRLVLYAEPVPIAADSSL
jgi:LPXTG-site transpeptidase (sortase) family protein